MQVSQVLAKLRDALAITGNDDQFEGLVAGKPEATVTRVGTCFAPSVDTIRRAAQAGCNLLLADAHPFYTYDAFWTGPGTRAEVDRSPVGVAKARLLEETGTAIIRLPTAFGRRFPSQAATSLAAAWGFHDARPPLPDAGHVIADIPRTGLDQLAGNLRERTGWTGARVMGKPDLQVRRVAVLTGLATPAMLGRMLADPAIDAIVAGEVIEWEGGPYFQDVLATGRPIGLILTGFAASRTPLAAAMAHWTQSVLDGVEVRLIPERCPVWTITRGTSL